MKLDRGAGARSWRPPTTSTCRSPSTARPPRSTTTSAAPARTPRRSARWRTWPRRASASQDQRGHDPRRTSTSSTSSRRSPTSSAPSCGSPGCARPAAAPTRGTSCTPPPRSSASSTTGCVARGEDVLTGDSFFHLSAFGEELPGLNLCGAGRVVCLIDPVGDVYACPFAIHEQFLAGNVRSAGRVQEVWRDPSCSRSSAGRRPGGACTKCLHYDSCQGGCMAAKFFTGLPLDGPDPECVLGYGEQELAARDGAMAIPRPRSTTPSAPRNRAARCRCRSAWGPDKACETSPLAGRVGRHPAGRGVGPGLTVVRRRRRSRVTRCDSVGGRAPCGNGRAGRGEARRADVDRGRRPGRAGAARPRRGDRAARPAPAARHRHRDRGDGRRAPRSPGVPRPCPTARPGSTRASPARCRSARDPGGGDRGARALGGRVGAPARVRQRARRQRGAVRAAVALLRSEGRDVAWFPCGVPGADAHAGHHETAVMLALRPTVARTRRPPATPPRCASSCPRSAPARCAA